MSRFSFSGASERRSIISRDGNLEQTSDHDLIRVSRERSSRRVPSGDTAVTQGVTRRVHARACGMRARARVRLTRAVYHIDWLPRSVVASAPVNG